MSEPQRGPGIWGKVHWRGLTVQLFVTVVLPLAVLLIGLAVGAVYFHQRAMRSLAEEHDNRAAALMAKALEAQLERRTSALEGLSAGLAVGAEPERALALAGNLQREFDAVAVSTRAGTLLAAHPSLASWQGWLQESGTDWWLPYGTAFSAPITTADGVVVLVAATADGKRWALGAFHPAALMQQTLRDAFPVGQALRVSLLDADGILLFEAPQARASGFLSPQALATVQPGWWHVSTSEGDHLIVARPVGALGWTLVVEEAWEQSATSWLQTTLWAPLLLVPLLLLMLWALWFGTRQVVMPLRQLESRATAAAWGNYAALAEPVEGIEEIRRLQRALRHMGQKVQRAQASRQDRKKNAAAWHGNSTTIPCNR